MYKVKKVYALSVHAALVKAYHNSFVSQLRLCTRWSCKNDMHDKIARKQTRSNLQTTVQILPQLSMLLKNPLQGHNRYSSASDVISMDNRRANIYLRPVICRGSDINHFSSYFINLSHLLWEKFKIDRKSLTPRTEIGRPRTKIDKVERKMILYWIRLNYSCKMILTRWYDDH